jgi:hypothetical protein
VLMALVSVMLKFCIFIHDFSGPTHSSVYTSLKSTVLSLHFPKLLQSPCVCLVACVQSKDYGNDNEIDSPLSPWCFL